MTKIIIALTTGVFLATGASAFAKSTALDVQDVPSRTVAIDYTPTAAIGVSSAPSTYYGEYSADNGFGDYSPEFGVLRGGLGIDYTPTAAIGSVSFDGFNFEYSAENGFGDYSPAPQVLR